jgi:hypothetical protein
MIFKESEDRKVSLRSGSDNCWCSVLIVLTVRDLQRVCCRDLHSAVLGTFGIKKTAAGVPNLGALGEILPIYSLYYIHILIYFSEQ